MSPRKPLPPIGIRLLGDRDTVAALVNALREIIDITHTTEAYDADPPYEVRRFIGASGLRSRDLPGMVADVRAAVKSWSRGNMTPEEALLRIQRRLDE